MRKAVRRTWMGIIKLPTMEQAPYFISFHFHFIIFKHKTLSAKKKKRETIQMSIYIYIKSYNFAGLPRDRASGRMLIL